MVIDFERSIIEWDGIELQMDMVPRSGRPFAAVLKADTECRAEINLIKPEEVPLDAMFKGSNLTEAEKAEVMKLVRQFEDLFTGALGTMKKEPYVLPLMPNAKPVAARPFPIPSAYYDATRREIQHLVDISDHVLLHRDAGVQGTMPPLFDGPFEVIAVQEHGTLTLHKGHYLEKVHIRRIRPCKGKRGGDCEPPQ
ncbi:hypothetical protein ON010_g15836 [Phytophthora cinnamomi]|nr:hypothetical protein ON010_g15836 [Phytophthora cinnamomi]